MVADPRTAAFGKQEDQELRIMWLQSNTLSQKGEGETWAGGQQDGLTGKRCLLTSLSSIPEPLWQKERTDTHMLYSDVHA